MRWDRSRPSCTLTSAVIPLVADPRPLFGIGVAMVAYNLVLELVCRSERVHPGRPRRARTIILTQISLDLVALTLLLYFSDIGRNPLVFYYVFHIVLASILLPGGSPYALALLASVLLGLVLFLQHWGVLPEHRLLLSQSRSPAGPQAPADSLVYLIGFVLAFTSTLGITVYLTTAVSRYVERVRSHIRQHEKMLGIGQLVSGIAHQISNPLDGLQNGLRQITQGVRGHARLEETARLMKDALGRIESVARRLQEFARPQGLELQACDVNKAVTATVELLEKGLSGIGILLESDLADVPKAWGDPYSVEEVVFNLCTNALDAMPGGGRLWIRTRETNRPEISPEGCVVIEVQDTGTGVPPEQLDRIFEPFYTTKAQSGGTGLGLWLCRMLLSEMGGRLEVESGASGGATFKVLLAKAPPGALEPGP